MGAFRRFFRWLFAPPLDREVLLWMRGEPAGPHLLGCPVEADGRKGVVVETTQLTITVEWRPK